MFFEVCTFFACIFSMLYLFTKKPSSRCTAVLFKHLFIWYDNGLTTFTIFEPKRFVTSTCALSTPSQFLIGWYPFTNTKTIYNSACKLKRTLGSGWILDYVRVQAMQNSQQTQRVALFYSSIYPRAAYMTTLPPVFSSVSILLLFPSQDILISPLYYPLHRKSTHLLL